jgi:lamin B
VRRLQQDNSRLTKEIRKREEYQSHEVTNVKHVYDQEIESLKVALDGLSKQYNQLKVASEGLLHENEDMKENLRRKENDLRDSQKLINDLRKELEDLSNSLRNMEIDKRVAENKMNETYPEVLSLRKKLAETKKILDEELFDKANLEDQCKRMDEELKFKIQLLESQLEEVRTRKEVEITEIDGKLQNEYEDKLQKALTDLRDVYESQMEQNKADLSNLYDSRVRLCLSHTF